MAQIEQLIVELDAKVDAYRRDMQRAFGQSESAADKSTAAIKRNSTGLAGLRKSGLAAKAGILAVAVGAAALLKRLQDLSDRYTLIANRIRTVIDEHESLADTMKDVRAAADDSRTSLDASAVLYQRIRLSSDELAESHDRLIDLTRTIGRAFAVSGASAQESAGAIRQLTQAFSLGALRGDEFNSVGEQAPEIMNALVAATGKTRGELRELAAEGYITSDLLIKSIEAYAPVIDATFEASSKTVSQASQEAGNAILSLVGEFAAGTGVAEGTASVIGKFSEGVRWAADRARAFAEELRVWIDVVLDARRAVIDWVASFLPSRQALEDGAKAVTDWIGKFLPFVKTAEDGSGVLERFAATAKRVFSVVVGYVVAMAKAANAALRKYQEVVVDVGAKVGDALNAMQQVILAIPDALAGLRDTAKEAFGTVQRIVGTAFDVVAAKVNAFLEPIRAAVSWLGDLLPERVREGLERLQASVRQTAAQVVQGAGELVAKGGQVVADATAAVVEGAGKLATGIKDVVVSTVQELEAAGEKALASVQTTFDRARAARDADAAEQKRIADERKKAGDAEAAANAKRIQDEIAEAERLRREAAAREAARRAEDTAAADALVEASIAKEGQIRTRQLDATREAADMRIEMLREEIAAKVAIYEEDETAFDAAEKAKLKAARDALKNLERAQIRAGRTEEQIQRNRLSLAKNVGGRLGEIAAAGAEERAQLIRDSAADAIQAFAAQGAQRAIAELPFPASLAVAAGIYAAGVALASAVRGGGGGSVGAGAGGGASPDQSTRFAGEVGNTAPRQIIEARRERDETGERTPARRLPAAEPAPAMPVRRRETPAQTAMPEPARRRETPAAASTPTAPAALRETPTAAPAMPEPAQRRETPAPTPMEPVRRPETPAPVPAPMEPAPRREAPPVAAAEPPARRETPPAAPVPPPAEKAARGEKPEVKVSVKVDAPPVVMPDIEPVFRIETPEATESEIAPTSDATSAAEFAASLAAPPPVPETAVQVAAPGPEGVAAGEAAPAPVAELIDEAPVPFDRAASVVVEGGRDADELLADWMNRAIRQGRVRLEGRT